MSVKSCWLWFVIACLLASAAACNRAEKATREASPAPVVLATATPRDLPFEIFATGTVEALRSVSIVAQVTGQVVGVHFAEGQNVRAGDALFTIDTRAYRVNLDVANAELQKERPLAAQAELEALRYGRLQADGLATDQELKSARATADAAQAALQAAQASIAGAKLNLAFATLRAPFDARTSELKLHLGSVVRANDPTPMVVLRQLSPARVRFPVPVEYLERIRQGIEQRNLVVRAKPRTESAENAQAEQGLVTFLDSSVETNSSTLAVKASFENATQRLWPGALVDVALQLEVAKQALVIPEAAVQLGQTGMFAFVVSDGVAHVRPITLERQTATEAIVSQGLKAGDQVVVDGFVRLDEGTRVQPRTVSSAAPVASGGNQP